MTYCIDWHLDPALGLNLPVINLESDADTRRALALNATLESFALLQMLQREQQREDDLFEYVFSATVRRLLELNGAVCGAVSAGPGLDSPAEIADMIFGSDGWRDSLDPGNMPPTRAAAPGVPTTRSGAVDATALVTKIRCLDATQFGRNDGGAEDDGRTVYFKAADELRAALTDIFADAPAGDSPRATGFLLAIAHLIVNSDARAEALESEALASVFEVPTHSSIAGTAAEPEVSHG